MVGRSSRIYLAESGRQMTPNVQSIPDYVLAPHKTLLYGHLLWVGILTRVGPRIDEYYGRETIDSIDAAPMSKKRDCNSPPKFS